MTAYSVVVFFFAAFVLVPTMSMVDLCGGDIQCMNESIGTCQKCTSALGAACALRAKEIDDTKRKMYDDAVWECNLFNQNCRQQNVNDCVNCKWRCAVAENIFPLHNEGILQMAEFCKKQHDEHIRKHGRPSSPPTPTSTATTTATASPTRTPSVPVEGNHGELRHRSRM